MKKLLLALPFVFFMQANAFAHHPNGTAYADVNGLVCDFCARALEKVFSRTQGVESIKVDLDKKVVTVHFDEGHNLDDATITKLITDSGYNVRGIRREGE